jgi:hypothetical protein
MKISSKTARYSLFIKPGEVGPGSKHGVIHLTITA